MRFPLARLLVITATIAFAATSVTIASAATAKPRGDLVPAGAGAVTWSYPLPVRAKILEGSITVTNPKIVSEVRTLVNRLPISDQKPRVCPMDMMLPYTVSFEKNAESKPFTKVVFQLGGCPYAQVYQAGTAIKPTLGGSNLSAVYAKIQHLIAPHGQPLA